MFSLEQIAKIVDGQLFKKSSNNISKEYSLKVSIDSRNLTDANIFLAIIGDSNDGHKYIENVVEQDIDIIIVSKKAVITDKANFILVDDTIIALGQIAKAHLQTLNCKTIGITGSSGKTTTKDILAQLLSQEYESKYIVYPEQSFNNEIGMPLTVLKANTDTKILILEMGASGIGHLKYLTDIAPLDYAIVLFVGSAHLGGFGSFEAVVKAKTELVQGLKPNGVAILNLDDEQVSGMQKYVTGRTIFYSANGQFCDLWAENIEMFDDQRPHFKMCSPATQVAVNLPLLGKHNVVNALAASALLQDLGVDLGVIAKHIEKISLLSEHRLNIQQIQNGPLIIDDSYNANLDSMKAGLTCLADISNARKKQGDYRSVAVLGEMLELGAESENIHIQVAKHINELKLDVVITVGQGAKPLADNLVIPKVFKCDDILDVEKLLEEYLTPKDIVLFKGSNGSKVYKLADKALKGGN